MSYTPMSNFYGATSNAQNNQQRYGTADDNVSRPNGYPPQMRGVDASQQGQYATRQYGWTTQNHNTSIANSQITYGSDHWQDKPSASSAFTYSRSGYAQPEPIHEDAQAYQARDTYNSQNTQGLNHLAYASGLEPAVPTNSNARSTQPPSMAGYTVSTGSNPQIRTGSPAHLNRRSSTTPFAHQAANTYSTTQNSGSSSGNSHDLALNAAAALAGAVRGRHGPSNQQQRNVSTLRTSISPMVNSAQTAPQALNRNPTPLYNTGPPAAQHVRNPSGQPTSVASSVTTNHSYSRPKNATTVTQSTYVHNASDTAALKETQSRGTLNTPQGATAHSHPQSIASLVSSTEIPEQQVQDSVENQEAMLNYIDPTQVFNPYHKEHERKKREAAVAEAQRKVEEDRRLEEAKRAAEEAAKHTREPLTPANSKSKVTKKAPKPASMMDASNSGQPVASSASPPPNEEMMAAELQQLMSRMKDIRSYNPILFQRLWNDMRAAAPPSTAPIATNGNEVPSPQATQTTLPLDSVQATEPVKPRSKKSGGNVQPTGIPLNGFKVVVDNNPEGLPDLGRFPAERRIRFSYGSHKQKHEALSSDQQSNMEPSAPTVPATAPIVPAANCTTVSQPPKSSNTVIQPADSGAAWPEPRRRAVAIAAVHLLRANPANISTTISPQDVCNLLERNPSYLDLCTALESRGLKFQRTMFARELLKNVPELQTPGSKSSTTAQREMATISAVAQGQPFTKQPATAVTVDPNITAPRSISSIPSGSHLAPALSEPAPVRPGPIKADVETPSTISKQISKSNKARVSHTARQEPPVGSKEASARKRDFAELIDLTEIDDNDNYVLPPIKQQKADYSPTTSDAFKQSDTKMATGFSNLNAQPLRFNTQPQTLSQPSVASMQTPSQQPGPQTHKPESDALQSLIPHTSKAGIFLAKKLDKKEALRKSYYDPRTVARDILISSGRHPSERSLNLHLAGMINLYIELDSDVSTLDWDAIDPGGPLPPKVDYIDVPAGPPRFKLGERVRKRPRMMDIEKSRESDAEARREARHNSPATRTPPISPTHSPAPSSRLSVPSINNGQDTSLRKLAHRQSSKIGNPTSNDASTVTPASRKISIDIPQVTSSSQTSTRSTSNKAVDPPSKMSTDTPTIKRRGRPPGAKNKHPSVTAMKKQAQATISEIKPDEPPEPLTHSYKCKWVKCHAELHNIDTLKRHILKKHVPEEKNSAKPEYICWWKKCQFLKPDNDGNMSASHIFESFEAWTRHIEKDHIEPVALKYGDGPRVTHTGKQNMKELNLSEFLYKPHDEIVTRTVSHTDPQSVELARQRYLADSDERATTPLVSPDGNSDQPHDAMTLIQAYPHGPKTDKEKSDVAAQNAFMRAHGNRHKDGRKAAEEVVRAMEVRKQKIGPGIDRGGCTLINEARRSTFDAAPGISRIVDYQY